MFVYLIFAVVLTAFLSVVAGPSLIAIYRWWFGGGIVGKIMRMRYPKASMDIYDPTSFEERRGVASQCEDSLQYGIRTYVDDMDDTVSKAFAALPTRLYLIGLDGRVTYAGGLGPWGFSPTKLGEAIEEYLEKQNST